MRTLFTVAASTVVVTMVTAGLIVGAPKGIAGQVKATNVVEPTASPRPVVLETPRPATTVEPRSELKPVPIPTPSSDCPQLNNPGGRIAWYRSADAGPWPTDGTVSIPTLGTSAPIVRVGVNTSGQMVVPANARQVAWLDQGGIPGRTNNLVLAGHVNWAGVAGTFHRIGELLPGDMVVLQIGGRKLIFRTVWVCQFARTSNLAPRIMGYTNVPSVTLITCSGRFDSYAGTHTERMVARAELVD